MPEYPKAVPILMRTFHERATRGGAGTSVANPLPPPFPSRDDLGEIHEHSLAFAKKFSPGSLDVTTDWFVQEVRRRLKRYAEKPLQFSEGLEAVISNILEAQEIVMDMQQANRTRQLFNLRLGQPPNLDMPFPLE